MYEDQVGWPAIAIWEMETLGVRTKEYTKSISLHSRDGVAKLKSNRKIVDTCTS